MMIAINVPQVAPRFDDVPDATLEVLCFGEAAVCFAVPEDCALGCCLCCCC